MRETEKKRLIERAEQWEQQSREMPLYGYPRKSPEIAETSVAIIKAICEQENVTPFIAKHALKMAAEIIEDESQYDAIL